MATTREEVVVNGRVFRAELPAGRCPACGEAYTPAEGVLAFGEAVARALIAEGDTSGETFRYLRHTLELSGQALAVKLGVAPETVTRWERGDDGVDIVAMGALKSLVLNALDRSELAAMVIAMVSENAGPGASGVGPHAGARN